MADVQKPLTIAAHAAIVLGIAYTVAQATWFFVVGPDVAPVRASAASPASSAPEPVPIERLVAQHIFGKPAAPGELPRREVTETLRETRLALELVGVFVADDAAASSAVIARKGRPAELYSVGDGLPGNAEARRGVRGPRRHCPWRHPRTASLREAPGRVRVVDAGDGPGAERSSAGRSRG